MPVSTLPRQLAALFLCAWVCITLFAADQRAPIFLSQGDRLDLGAYLEPGKTVVFGFYSKFSPACPCEPCGRLDNPAAALQASRDDLLVVMVDIDREGATQIDWNSPVAMQFGLRQLPHFKVFGPDGKILVEDNTQKHESLGLEWVHGLIEALPEHSGSRVAATAAP